MINKIITMPKVELHLHLDGSLSIPLARKINDESINNLCNKMIAPSSCKDLTEYLDKFAYPNKLLCNKINIKLFTKELIRYLTEQNVIYAEIRFSITKIMENGLNGEEILDTMIGVINESSIKVNLILCLMRGDTFENNANVIKLANAYLGKGVGGVDLAGDEINYPFNNYIELFNLVREFNIPYTIHSGEVTETDLIEVLNYGTKRIGHGIKCINNTELMNKIIEQDILLEVCPTSNVHTKNVDNYLNHPIKKLMNNNVKVCLNTDNVTVSNISLINEYLKLYNMFGFNLDDFKKMNLNAINYAFISESEKEELRRKIEDFN